MGRCQAPSNNSPLTSQNFRGAVKVGTQDEVPHCLYLVSGEGDGIIPMCHQSQVYLPHAVGFPVSPFFISDDFPLH